MPGITVNDALNDFEKLSDGDKEYFLEIANKQLIELRRKHLADRVAEAEQNYSSGKTKSGGTKDLLKDLAND
jgi:hypothetical protein